MPSKIFQKSIFRSRWVKLEDIRLSTLTIIVLGGRIDPLYNDLAFHTKHIVCVNFKREWRDLYLNIDKLQIFLEYFFKLNLN